MTETTRLESEFLLVSTVPWRVVANSDVSRREADRLVGGSTRALSWRGDSSLGSGTAGMQVQFCYSRRPGRCRMPEVYLMPGE
jgi:hypothetical protein